VRFEFVDAPLEVRDFSPRMRQGLLQRFEIQQAFPSIDGG